MFWRVRTAYTHSYTLHTRTAQPQHTYATSEMLLSVNAITDTESGHFLHQLSRQWGMWPEASHAAGSPAPHLSVPPPRQEAEMSATPRLTAQERRLNVLAGSTQCYILHTTLHVAHHLTLHYNTIWHKLHASPTLLHVCLPVLLLQLGHGWVHGQVGVVLRTKRSLALRHRPQRRGISQHGRQWHLRLDDMLRVDVGNDVPNMCAALHG
jgi:hypothetical protein